MNIKVSHNPSNYYSTTLDSIFSNLECHEDQKSELHIPKSDIGKSKTSLTGQVYIKMNNSIRQEKNEIKLTEQFLVAGIQICHGLSVWTISSNVPKIVRLSNPCGHKHFQDNNKNIV